MELPELTQEEFNKFALIAMEVYADQWYSDSVLIEIAEHYNLEYDSVFN